MRVTDYKRISELKSDDILLLDSDREGTRTIQVSNLAKQLNKVLYNASSTAIPLPVRRMTYRGKYLGNTITEKQRAAIFDGSFDDMYTGDYWVINGRTWIIVDFDTWFTTKNGKNESIDTHHVVLMNANTFNEFSMNDTDTISGGWYGSKMYNTHLENILSRIIGDFGATSVMPHPRNQLDGRNHQTQLDIPTFAMISGSNINAANVTMPYSSPLALALLDPMWFTYLSVQDTHTTGFYCIFSNRELTKQAASANCNIKVMICISGN